MRIRINLYLFCFFPPLLRFFRFFPFGVSVSVRFERRRFSVSSIWIRMHCIGCVEHALLFVISFCVGGEFRARHETRGTQRAARERWRRRRRRKKTERAKNYDNLFLDDLYKLQSLDMLICPYSHHMYTRCRRFCCFRCIFSPIFFSLPSLVLKHSSGCCSVYVCVSRFGAWDVFSFDIRSNYSFGAGAAAHHFWMRILFFGFCVKCVCVGVWLCCARVPI